MRKHFLLGNEDTFPGVTGYTEYHSDVVTIKYQNSENMYQIREVTEQEFNNQLQKQHSPAAIEARRKKEEDERYAVAKGQIEKTIAEYEINGNLPPREEVMLHSVMGRRFRRHIKRYKKEKKQ